ncbi:MAG: TIGR04282 family arsenosugar biosynthesis glycosyltransferase [Verrucomicrobia bacterium]|nr:TIGR04282 family arsenosugar biosynthesis glycosyltransferase [Verrucomicrobiota bacterium]
METPPETREPARKSDCVLVVMAKAPRPGLVKTRLIRSLPAQAVTSFYRCLLDDTLALAGSLAGVETAIMCPESDVEELAVLAEPGVRVIAQNGQGLAAGLSSVFTHFAEDHQRRIIAFNSDSPHLPRSVLEAAFETLAVHDLVVGPTYDGGYYLVGANRAHSSLFMRDGMGTGSALENLLSQARVLELSVGFMDPFYDIDVADDLIQLAAELEDAPAKAPRTAFWLKEWGDAITQLRTGTAD